MWATEFVELRVQDAADTLKQSMDAEWDLILLDADIPRIRATG